MKTTILIWPNATHFRVLHGLQVSNPIGAAGPRMLQGVEPYFLRAPKRNPESQNCTSICSISGLCLPYEFKSLRREYF